MKGSNRTSKRSLDKLGLEAAERTGAESRLTSGCSRRLPASAALPLPGAPEPQRSVPQPPRLRIAELQKDQVDMQLPNGERAIVPIEKLRDYCLHPTHRVGSHKAHVFESILGLTAAHAEELQQRLVAVARTGEAVLGLQNAYGQRDIIDFEMTTTVGTAVVRSTWIILVGDDVPRLTSCYVL